jgi:hypothetical protein
MNCAEIEILICDYVGGTLGAAETAEVERHLSECADCAELARDSAAAVAFIGRAADVEPPPELITRILFDAPWAKAKPKSKARQWLSAILSPIMQPKYAMGMAMTILSISMLARFVHPVKQPKLEDLRPSRVWAGVEEKAVRTWTRTLKFYDNLKFVYQIQTTLREWQQQDEEQKPERKNNDDRKLPVKTAPEGSVPGAAAPPQGTGEPH